MQLLLKVFENVTTSKSMDVSLSLLLHKMFLVALPLDAVFDLLPFCHTEIGLTKKCSSLRSLIVGGVRIIESGVGKIPGI